MAIKTLKRCVIAAATAALAISAAAPAHAGAIVSAVGAVINVGGPGSGLIADTYNQNGLLPGQGYVSGVTDYDSYIATNPQHNWVAVGNEWFAFSAAVPGSYTVTYDLGALRDIDAFALWNEDFAGATVISLLASATNLPGSFSPVFSNSAAPNTADNTNYGPASYSFGAVNARYFRLVGSQCKLQNGAPSDLCGIGEVAWRDVPEPAGLALMGAALLGLGLTTRRRSRATSDRSGSLQAPAALSA